MRISYVSALLGPSLLASAAVLPLAKIEKLVESIAPKLSLDQFKNPFTTPLSLDSINEGLRNQNQTKPVASDEMMATAGEQCGNPRVRPEWDSYSRADRQNYIDAIKCLMSRPPSGSFAPARNRYEDLVRLHQMYTPNIHGNAKFLIWHRYFMWVFESVMRDECGFTAQLPWFDETRYTGRFSQSSVFSNEWFGAVGTNGDCVRNGQFNGITLNIGPGTGAQPHCLQRNGDRAKTQNVNQALVDACNNYNDYKDMAACAEGGVHAWGHNGIGGVMADVYGSPGDPTFFLHHAFIDRNFRIWQNKDPARITDVGISGTDVNGNQLTMDTRVNSAGLRGDVSIRDILDTLGTKLCYRYQY